MLEVKNLWGACRKLAAYLAPERSYPAIARKQIAVVTALLAVAAIAGAVVLKPSRHSRRPDPWAEVKQQIRNRAQVDLFDDFSSGLDSWQGDENIASSWSYDRNGFVNPGALSLFAPSLHLTNYDLDTLVQIESKGVGLVFRAEGPRTYQAVRIRVEGTGPMSFLAVERYYVADGRASRPVRVRYPSQYQADTMYRVHLQVRGDAFALFLQGQLVDYWSDNRLRSGGVGLFCGRGERARVAWIRVSQNTDSLGRMCSVLAAMF
ncbi:MAG TPA: hypothetical protein VME17_11585 [Bryobacteraceae bacterium]|nr:hypothetical protein [Bryobacteraceae bacterium]